LLQTQTTTATANAANAASACWEVLCIDQQSHHSTIPHLKGGLGEGGRGKKKAATLFYGCWGINTPNNTQS